MILIIYIPVKLTIIRLSTYYGINGNTTYCFNMECGPTRKHHNKRFYLIQNVMVTRFELNNGI